MKIVDARRIVLNELFDQPARWRWDMEPDPVWGSSASFVLGDAEYTVMLAPDRDMGPAGIVYYLQFSMTGHADPEVWARITAADGAGAMGVTGTSKGEQSRIFATVIDIMRTFDRKYPVAGWKFTAEEPNRRRLYSAMLRRFASREGFDFFERGRNFEIIKEPMLVGVGESRQIAEVLDRPAPWKWTRDSFNDKAARFRAGDLDYKVNIWQKPIPYVREIGWEVTFEILGAKGLFGAMDITGTGNQFLVFATVADIVKRFIEKERPSLIAFSAYEPTRIRLYSTLSRKLARKYGYEVSMKKSGLDTYFHLTKK